MNKSIFTLLIAVVLIGILRTSGRNLTGTTSSTKVNVFDTIQVGNKTSDSTGQLLISNAQIQANIFPKIPGLNGATIASDAAVLALSKQVNYLMFRIQADSGRTSAVAVELSLQNNKLRYEHISGKQVHRANSRAGCVSNLIRSSQKYIMGCGCNGQTVVSPNCQYVFFSE